jgi:hypothetical protein
MSGVDGLEVLQPVRIVARYRYERTIVSGAHWKLAICLTGRHHSLHGVCAFNVEYIEVLYSVKEEGILFGKDMKQLIARLEIVRYDLNVHFTTMRIIVPFLDPGSHGYVLST